jgi:glycosyltransferase involved in cell wall biosynthesis
MKILFLTQYFPPEVGAPQNRLFELALKLKEKGADVTVLTAMPNYPEMKIHKGYRKRWYAYEEIEELKVHRSAIFVSQKRGAFYRLLNYFSFVFTSFLTGWLKLYKQDYIICESPPLFLGISALALRKMVGGKIIFNVADLWPESAEQLGIIRNKKVLKATTWLEEILYQNADLITGQTNGIINNIQQRFPHKKVYWLPNGVDTSYFYLGHKNKTDWRSVHGFKSDDFILLYAGNLGHAQGLEVVLNAATLLVENEQIKFVFVGDGPERKELEQQKERLNLQQVFFFDTVKKREMPALIATSNAAVIPLKKLPLFEGAIPSKIFENLAMKKPILLGVEGEANELFIQQGKAGLEFEPENDRELADQILKLYESPILQKELGEYGYEYVATHFSRQKIADEFWEQLNKQ